MNILNGVSGTFKQAESDGGNVVALLVGAEAEAAIYACEELTPGITKDESGNELDKLWGANIIPTGFDREEAIIAVCDNGDYCESELVIDEIIEE